MKSNKNSGDKGRNNSNDKGKGIRNNIDERMSGGDTMKLNDIA